MEIGSASVRIIDSQLVRPNYLRLGVDTIRLTHPDGTEAPTVKRDYLKSRDAVAILVFADEEQEILLLRQYRHPVYVATGDINRAYIYEVVAGCRDGEEDPLETAVREIKEETGIEVDQGRIRKLRSVFTSPGISTEQIHLFMAFLPRVVAPTANGLEAEGERTMPVWLPRAKVQEMVGCGQIEDAKTLLLLAGSAKWL